MPEKKLFIMKNIRYVLYLLVVISMMLWNAWEKENVKNEVIQEATQPSHSKDNLTTNIITLFMVT